jgi:hypothetical protein
VSDSLYDDYSSVQVYLSTVLPDDDPISKAMWRVTQEIERLRAELAAAREDTERLKVWLVERIAESVEEMQRHHDKGSGMSDVWDGMSIAYQRCVNQIDAVRAGEENPSE